MERLEIQIKEKKKPAAQTKNPNSNNNFKADNELNFNSDLDSIGLEYIKSKKSFVNSKIE